MGSESPSNSAADSGSGRASYARATQQYRQSQASKKRREREETRVQQLNKSAYVKGSGGVARSSSGSAVIAGRAGERAVEQSRQIELDRIYDTPEKKLEAARVDLEARRRGANPISRATIDRQLAALDSGASPQFSLTASGGFTTTGVKAASEGYDSTRNIAPISRGVTSATTSTSTAKASEPEAPVVTTRTSTSDAARRKLLAQGQKGAKARIFYGGR